MAFGIFGTAQQAGFHQGQTWEKKGQKGAGESVGFGAAVAGLSALVQAKKEIAALKAVRKALTEALAEVAPKHPLNNKDLRNKIHESAYDEA